MSDAANIRSVALFVTCVADLLAPDVPAAVVTVMRSAGRTVACPEGQTCCGQPAWNAGFAPEAARVAATSLDALAEEEVDAVVVPAGSCATMIRLYWPDLFERVGDPARAARARDLADRVWELTELVAADGTRGRTAPVVVARHRSCHMERELGLRDEPAQVLDRIAGCEVVEWEADDRCCGFGGTFSAKLPEVSVAMADDKLDALPEGVTEIVGADTSCLLHLQARARDRGTPVEVRHVAEVVAASMGPDEPSPEAGAH